jgi:hypothetical protein
MTSINDSRSARHRFFFGRKHFFCLPCTFPGVFRTISPFTSRRQSDFPHNFGAAFRNDFLPAAGPFCRQGTLFPADGCPALFVRPGSVRDRSGDHAGWRPAGFFRDPEGCIRSGLLRPASGFPGAGCNSKASFRGHTRRRALEHCPGGSRSLPACFGDVTGVTLRSVRNEGGIRGMTGVPSDTDRIQRFPAHPAFPERT